MNLWYARDEVNSIGNSYYIFGNTKLAKRGEKKMGKYFFEKNLKHSMASVEDFEKLLAPSACLKPGEGPFKLKPLERA